MPLDALLEQRRLVAQKVARRLTVHPAIASVVVFGSVATATVDEYSDVDMLVICHPEIVPVAKRSPILGEMGNGWAIGASTDNALFATGDENGLVDDIPVTLHYQKAAWIDAVLHAVLVDGSITTELLPFRPYTLPALLQRAWLLYDSKQHVEQWREQIKHYPPLLKHNIVQHFMPILRDETEELTACAQRGIGPRNFLFHLNRSVDALISILYALNDVFDPADRRASSTVWPLLKIVPVDFVRRLTVILEGPFNSNGMKLLAQQYSELVQEVTRLVSVMNAPNNLQMTK